MTNCYDNQNNEKNYNSNSGFIFGLLCGAVIGAIVAIIIYKNNQADVFEKLSHKIKEFFESLVKNNSKKSFKKKKKTKNLSKKLISKEPITPVKQEITPIFIKPKKTIPKTFIKSKR